MESVWASLIGDVWSFHLAIIGILISVMTLLYTSLCGKVEELNSIEQSKEYAIMNRAIAVRNTIEQLRKLNKQVMVGLVVSFCSFILTTIIKYLPEGCVIKWIAILNTIIILGLLVFGVKLVHSVYSQYQKETI